MKEQAKAAGVMLLYLLIIAISFYCIEQKPLTRYSAEEYEAIFADR